ncbi:MAG: acylphosphatase [Planctomycetota bacterium]
MKHIRVQVIISGLVQGVFFRATTEEEAQKRGLVGWVKNRPDGKVEAVLEGPPDEVESMIKWCHQGPPEASVEKVELQRSEATGEFYGFEMKY